jgi:quercetin dioxygenase-like cupin family protein
MGTIRFVDGNNREFKPVKPQYRDNVVDGTASFSHHPGSDGEPRLFEVSFPPDAVTESHAHDVDEIIVVMEGEMRFGKQTYGVGSSVYIPKMTLYSFQAGPEGLRFLNFRTATSAVPHINKDEFMAMRAQASG